jgi:hypothetical protein
MKTKKIIKKGVGDPSPFTVSQMPFFRGFISKVCLKNKVLEGISKKGVAPPTYSRSARCRSFGDFISKVCRKNKVSQGISKRFFSPHTSKDSAKTPRKNERQYFFNEFYIAGYRYYDGETITESLLEGKPVTFKREPHCIYDTKAVAIYAGRKKLGYVPRKDNTMISTLMDQGVIIKGKIQKRNFDDQPRKRVKISVFTSFN